MQLVLELLPFVGIFVVLAIRSRASVLAGIVALVLALPALSGSLGAHASLGRFLLDETLAGLWLAWHAIAVIASGFFFHQCARIGETRGREAEHSLAFSHRRLFAACYLIGPFTESATGFGIGFIATFVALKRLGIADLHAAALGLLSQILVAWGAMAVGTIIGAAIVGMPDGVLGASSVLVTVPLFVAYLAGFWVLARIAGHPPSPRDRLVDALWTGALCGALALAQRHLATEIAALSATGVLLGVHLALESRRWTREAWRRALRTATPYTALVMVLIASRLVPALGESLKALRWAPVAEVPPYYPLYAPALWLLVIGSAALLAGGQGRALGIAAWSTARQVLRPVAVTIAFVVFARWVSAAGIAQSLANTLFATAGPAAVLASPVLAALGGFLTGSNTGSNAMMIAVQAALGERAGLPAGFLSGVQNAIGSSLTMFSPIRVAMGAALTGGKVHDGEIYRLTWPVGIGVIAIGVLIVAGALVTRG